MRFDLSKMNIEDENGHKVSKKRKDIVDLGVGDINDSIAPDAIELEANYIKIGNRYIRTMVVTGYPRSAYAGWLNKLYSFSGNIDISSHITPLPSDKVIDSLNRKISQYMSTKSMDVQKGRLSDVSVNSALSDAIELRDSLHKSTEKLFYMNLYISIAGKDLDELDELTARIEKLCGEMTLSTRHAMLEQDQGFVSCLPIADNRLKYKRNFTTSSLATCIPFVSAELTDTTGEPILYGLNILNGSLVMFDRFELQNYNSVTLAVPGSGKSYAVKLEAIRYRGMNTNIIIIDPEGEYKILAEKYGGQHIELSAASKHRINPLEIESTEEDEGEDFLTSKMLDVVSMLEVIINEEFTARQQKVVLDAIEETYRKKGITRNKESLRSNTFVEGEMFRLEGSKKKMPTLSDLEFSLRQSRDEGEEGLRIADKMQPYTTGIMGLFNGETNVDLNSKFIVFDTSKMEKNLMELSMFIALEFIWNKIKKKDNVKRLVIVDEAYLLMKERRSAEFLEKVAKRARKYRAGLSIVTQNIRDFFKYNAQSIISNAAMKILLKQAHNELPMVAETLGLSYSEQEFLRAASPGEALIFAGDRHTAVQLTASKYEHVLCTTKPTDVVKYSK